MASTFVFIRFSLALIMFRGLESVPSPSKDTETAGLEQRLLYRMDLMKSEMREEIKKYMHVDSQMAYVRTKRDSTRIGAEIRRMKAQLEKITRRQNRFESVVKKLQRKNHEDKMNANSSDALLQNLTSDLRVLEKEVTGVRENLVCSGVLAQCEPNSTVRLAGGSLLSEGRVEIWHDGRWGSICGRDWDRSEADVTCGMLGYIGGSSISSSKFGDVHISPWLKEVGCNGNESRIEECQLTGWDVEKCHHSEYAAVVCTVSEDDDCDNMFRCGSGNCVSYAVICDDTADCTDSSDEKHCDEPDIDLWGDESDPTTGNVVVTLNGIEGSICAEGWDNSDATVVCGMLGFGDGKAVVNGEFGAAPKPVWFMNFDCDGTEKSIYACRYDSLRAASCSSEFSHGAGVRCDADDMYYDSDDYDSDE